MAIVWKDTKPSWFSAGSFTQSAFDSSPFFTLPSNRKYAATLFFQDDTHVKFLSKGATHINKFSLDNPDTGLPEYQVYNDLLPDHAMLPQGVNTTSETIDSIVNSTRLNAIFGTELENEGFVSPTHPKVYEFYSKLYTRYQAKKNIDGYPFFVMKPNYDSIQNLSVTDVTKMTRLYNDAVNTWGIWEINDAAGRWNAVTVSGYLHTHYAKYMLYDIAAQSELITKASLVPVLFSQPFFEWPGGVAYGPGYQHGINAQGGIMYRAAMPWVPYEHEIAKIFLTAFFSNESVFIPWGVLGRSSRNPDKLSLLSAEMEADQSINSKDTFIGPGAFQYNADLSNRYNDAHRRHSIFQVGMHLLSTCSETEGGTRRYCRHRVNGGAWIEPSTMEPVTANTNQRGMAVMREKAGKKDIFYFNIFAPNSPQSIEIQDPYDGTTIYPGTVFGSKVHLTRI